MDLSAKHREIISDWIFVWADYLKYEKTFKPDRLRIYRRGEIVHVNFGFNIGNELGGPHYAVVLDTYNSRGNGCVVVAPISSLKKGRTPQSLHPSEIYLGKVIPGSDVEGYLMLLQIRCISKMRIIKPKTEAEEAYSVTAEQLKRIDKKIIKLFTQKA